MSSAGPIERMPMEMRSEILSYLKEEKETLRNVRLVSKKWEKAASEYLFDRVYLSDHPDDIETYYEILNSRFCKYIGTLVRDTSGYNPKMRDEATFFSLSKLHPGCHHDDPLFPGHDDDVKKKQRFHDWLASHCNNDATQMLQLRTRCMNKVHAWWLEQLAGFMRNRERNVVPKAIHDAHTRGVKFGDVIHTALPLERDEGFRPDQPFRQPDRSPATRKRERKFKGMKKRLAQEESLEEVEDIEEILEGVVPLEEILPRVNWSTHDLWLATILNHAGDTKPLQEWSDQGISLQEWEEARDAGNRNLSRCFHPIAVVEPYRELMSLVQTLREISAPVSTFSIVPSGKAQPTDSGRQFQENFYLQDASRGMSTAIFLRDSPELRDLVAFISPIKVLRLHLQAIGSPQISVAEAFSYPGLEMMLEQGSQIQELYLHIDNHQYCSNFDVLRGVRLPALRKVHFHDLGFWREDLFQFVHEHRMQLEELIVFYCRIVGYNEDNERDAEWWPVLDKLRRMGCFGGTQLYINRVHQQPREEVNPDLDMLELEEGLTRDEGMVRWKSWVDGQGPFPLEMRTG